MFVSCGDDDSTNPADTTPPEVMITYPTNNQEIPSGAEIDITAEATDNKGIASVKFFVNGQEQYEDSSEPYSFTWNTNNLSGDYSLYAKATDTSEDTATSDLVAVTILEISNPNPVNNATEVGISPTLSWIFGRNYLTFDVYFSTTSEPELVSENQTERSFDPGNLDYETTYYWQIVASDGEYETEGDVWQFTTMEGGAGTVTDIDGNVYQTLVIGDQEWMVENLKVTHYRNGDPIPNLTSDGDWTSTNSGAYCAYSNSESNADTYGYLYNWYAVDTGLLAPEGWHVPTDEEIKQLEMHLGMSESEVNDYGGRGTNEGSKLAGRADLWNNGNLENDPEFGSSGFAFLPGGYRSFHRGNFDNMSNHGYFWSSTEDGSNPAWYRLLNYSGTQVYRDVFYKRYGFSVRCVRDQN